MSASLDLNYLPLINHPEQPGGLVPPVRHSAGLSRTHVRGMQPAVQAATGLPGLYIAPRPRQAARGRQDDRLILYLTLMGDAFLTPERQNQLLSRLAQVYYKTSGSVTGALRNVAATLNQYILDRNLHAGSGGNQTIGVFNQAIVRDERLYLAHCGEAHTFLITATGAHHFCDLELSGRGLGLGKSFVIRYYQAELKPSDSIILTPRPPSAWSDDFLTGLYGQGPESLRRRLGGAELEAALIQVKKGTGRIFMLRPKSGVAPDASMPALESVPAREAVTGQEPKPTGASPDVIVLPAQLQAKPVPESAPTPAIAKSSRPDGMIQIWVKFWKNVGGFFARCGKSFGSLVSRMLPGEVVSGISSSVLAFFAVAIPLVVVTVATMIYFRSGRASQYQVYYQQAQQAVGVAQVQTDPRLKRAAWQNVLAYLNQAENYAQSPEINALRAQAQQVIDELDGVKRLNFLPALDTGLPDDVRIVRLAATENELFMLNATDGSILRAISVARGYDRDETFQCRPGVSAGINIGALIDFETLPKSNRLTSGVLAMDANGGILNCAAGEDPKASQLKPPPGGLGKLNGFALDLGNLYVLDPEKNAVWIYWKTKLDEEPELFFSEEIPPMADVIDLAVNEGDLYLLHADGHITMCTYSNLGVSPTRCTDPLNYIDSRPGYENSLFTPEEPFSQILATQPPDPSLYLFEAESHAIYHFSLRQLTLHRQYRPENPSYSKLNGLSKPATAFAISADNRLAFIALGNQVEYASMP